MKSSQGLTLYNRVWRWHFYAGLFCLPFIMTLAISGTIYLFKPQIESIIDQPYRNLPVQQDRATANEQITAALDALPGSRFLSYQLPESMHHAVVVGALHRGDKWLVYVDPYSARVLKMTAEDDQFTHLVRSFHGELLAGNAGSIVVELAGCWAIVLVITGLYLWWPRDGNGLAGVVYPRLNSRGRPLWRDLHAVIGFWISLLTLFLLVTGLPWALVWGTAFKEIRHIGAPATQQDWSLGRTQEHQHEKEGATGSITLPERLVSVAEGLNMSAPVILTPIGQATWQVTSQSQNRPRRSEATIDARTGAVLQHTRFADRPVIDRVIGIGVAAHEGQLFGWLNQLLGVITTTGLMVMSVSGFVLWRKRKPQGSLGAPRALPDAQAGKAVTAIVLSLALVLPLLALSLVGVWLLEVLVLRRFVATRTWLGIT
jgi:uncharacterized iron-regulated membrane protein